MTAYITILFSQRTTLTVGGIITCLQLYKFGLNCFTTIILFFFLTKNRWGFSVKGPFISFINEILKSYFEKANKKRDVQLGPEGS